MMSMSPLMRAALLTILMAFSASACAPRQAPPLDLTFVPCPGDYISKDGDPLTLSGVVDMAAGADYVLLGEHHKNVCDHNIQQQVVAALALSDRPPALGLEMVAVDKNPVFQEFAKGDMSLEDLERELEWDERWGFPFALFAPLFRMARDHDLPLAGLNVPKDVLDKARDQGVAGLSPEERAMYPAEVLPRPAEQEEALKEAFGLHEGLAGHLERFFQTQAVWDTMMAEQALALRRRTGRPVVIIAGSGHVEFGWGIAHRLRTLDPRAGILLLDGYRGGKFDPQGADAFFHCPPSFSSKLGMTLEVRLGRVLVVRVLRGSRADKAGLRPGDEVLAVQGRELTSFMDLHDAGRAAHENDEPLVFTVDRDGRTEKVSFGILGQEEPDGARPEMEQ